VISQIPSGSAIWVYQGGLYDPMDGRKIANVEGLELVRHLADCYSSKPQTLSRYTKRCFDLQAPTFLNTTATGPTAATWDYATTCLTRKMFCYTTTATSSSTSSVSITTNNNRQPSPRQQESLLSKIRLRPTSPQRRIPTEQAVALYDAATTFISRFDGQELVVHTERPDTSTLWGEAIATEADKTDNANNSNDGNGSLTSSSQSNNDSDDKSSSRGNLDFTVYAKRRATNDLPALLMTSSRSKKGDADVIVSPKRTKLIQFGAGTESKGAFRLGARETYNYFTTRPSSKSSNKNQRRRQKRASDQDQVRVRYTRYGEGPPWYGPHKMCTLELKGRRITSMTQIPPLSANLIADHIPGFLSVHTPIPNVVVVDEEEDATTTTNKNKNNIPWMHRLFPQRRQDYLEDLQEAIELSDQAASQSVHWFRDCHTLPLKLHDYSNDTDNDDDGSSRSSTTNKLRKWWHHFEKSTKINKY